MKRVTNCRLNYTYSDVTTTKLNECAMAQACSELIVRNKKKDPNTVQICTSTQNWWNLIVTFSRKNKFFFSLSTASQLNNDNSCGYRRARIKKERKMRAFRFCNNTRICVSTESRKIYQNFREKYATCLFKIILKEGTTNMKYKKKNIKKAEILIIITVKIL